MSDIMNPYQKNGDENTVAQNTAQLTQGAAQANTMPSYRKEYTVKKPLALPKNFTAAGQTAENAGQHPTKSRAVPHEKRDSENIGKAAGSGSYWEREDVEGASLEAVRAKNAEYYQASLPDFEYEALNAYFKDIARTDGLKAAESEKWRYMNALQYTRMYGIPLEDALSNLDTFNRAIFGEDTEGMDYKGKMERLGDAWTLGANTLKRSKLGRDLMIAEESGDDAATASAWEAVRALDHENELLSTHQPQALGMTLLTAGLQSLPYTAVAAGAGILGGMIGIGPVAGFAAGYDLMRADSYINLRQAGADTKTARNVSAVSGALQAAVEQSLGIVAHGAAHGAAIAGKKVFSPLTEGAERTLADKVTKLAFSHFKLKGTAARMATSFAAHHIADVAEEGAEEFLQQVIDSVSFHVADALSENEVEADDLEKIVRDSVEAFKGGVAGALFLGVFDAGFSAKANIRDFKDLKEAAETIPSREAFKKATKENLAFEGMSDEKRIAAQNAIYDSFESARESADEKEIENIRATKDIAEGVETVKADEDTGEEIAAGEAVRDESGKLYVQEDKNVSGNTKRLLFGDPTREGTADDGNRYGYIEYTENGDKVNIEKFVMAGQRENIRQEAWEMFAERVAGKDIEWNTRLEEDAKIKQAIIDANPSGKSAGLNYYAGSVQNAQARISLARQLEKYAPKITKTERSYAIALAESMARHQAFTLADWTAKKFRNGEILTDQFLSDDFAIAAQREQAQGREVYGAAQFTKDLKAAIYVSKNADFDTFAHELWHVAEHNMTDSERGRAESFMRELYAKMGKEWTGWTTEAKELYADTGVEALRTGKLPIKGYEDLFQRIAEFIADVYRGFQSIAHELINDDIAKEYSRLLSMDESLLSKAEQAVSQASEEREKNIAEEAKAWREQKQKEAASKTQKQTTAEHVSAKADEIVQSVTADPVATDGEKAGAVLDAAAVGVSVTQGVRDMLSAEGAIDLGEMIFQVVSDEEIKTIIKDIKHTEERQDYIDRYYTQRKEEFEVKNYTSSDGKLSGDIETYKKRTFDQKEIDDSLFFVNKGINVTLLPEGEVEGEKNPDALFNHSVLVEYKNLTSEKPKNIADKIKESANKQNSEIITVFFDRENKADYDSIFNEVEKKKNNGDITGSYDELWLVKGGEITRLNKNRSSPAEANTQPDISVAQEYELVKQKYQNTDQWLKAPNGEPSNLSEKQWLTVRTPAFKAWFGDWEKDPENASKVVDENGEPLVVYHGSNQWFQVFNEGKANKSNVNTPDNTIFTNDNKEIASSFENYYGGRIRDVILDENSPLHRKYDWGVYRAGGVYSLFMNLRNPKVLDYKGQTWKTEGMNINHEVAKAMHEGYDGFIARNIIDVGFTDVTPPASNDYIAFNNTAVKSATDNTGDFDANNPNILFQIAGEIGAQNLDQTSPLSEGMSRMENLAVAKSMEAAGKDAQAIRLATGWEKGADGLWRWEIDDSGVRTDTLAGMMLWESEHPRLNELIKKSIDGEISTEEIHELEELQEAYGEAYDYAIESNDFAKEKGLDRPFMLPQVIDFPELFTAYPELKDAVVKIADKNTNVEGVFRIYTKDGYREIVFYRPSTTEASIFEENAKSVLLHEIQHAIQRIEGFATGGSPEQFVKELEAKNPLTPAQKDLLKDMQAYMDARSEMRPDFTIKDYLINLIKFEEKSYAEDYEGEIRSSSPEELENQYRSLKEKAESYNNGKPELSPQEQYHALAGEVEARNVEARRKLTPMQRAQTLLALTEDVAREDQIVLMPAQKILFQTAYHGSGASFDRFNTEEYGLSGEGSMSFGWGTYLSGSEKIARGYAERQSGSSALVDKLMKKYPEAYAHITPIVNNMSTGQSFEEAKNSYISYWKENHIPGIRKMMQALKGLDGNDFAAELKRNLYTVDIPDGKYLQWDKHLPEQELNTIKAALQNRGYTDFSRLDNLAELQKKYADNPNATYTRSSNIYKVLGDLLGSQKAASQFLHSIGYTGIDYPAGTIYGNGNDARNYVIFDDNDIKIKEHVLFQTAYHGSAASFDKFDTEHYGLSGEGSMSFGYGAYVTASEEIARDYAERQYLQKFGTDTIESHLKSEREHLAALEEEIKEYENKDVYESKTKQLQKELETASTPWRKKVLTYALSKRSENERLNSLSETSARIAESKEKIETLEKELADTKKNAATAKRHLYTVDIPDGGFIVWDKTVPKAKRMSIMEKLYQKLIKEDYAGAEADLRRDLVPTFEAPAAGKELYQNIWTYLGGDKETSQFLSSIGYAGIDYPAGTNYGNGNGARNFVIFKDEDAQIKDHVLFQSLEDDELAALLTPEEIAANVEAWGEEKAESAPAGDGTFSDFDADIIAEAATFNSWEEWRDFVETMYSENVTPEMDDAWYKNVWEGAHKAQEEELKKVTDDIVEDEENALEVSADAAEESDIVPDNGTVSEEEAHPIDSPAREPKKTKKQKKAEADAQEAEEAQKDADFIDLIQREGELDKFLSVLNMDWLKLPDTPGDMEEALEAERLLKLRAKANVELKHGSWGTAALKAGHVQYGENVGLSQKHRKTLLTLMKKAPRDYRNVYAAYMKNTDWIVPEKYTTAAKLAYRISSPVEEMEALTPEERREFAKRLDFEDLKKEVYDGTFEMDFENIEKLVDGYETDIKALEGKIDKLKGMYHEDEVLLVKNNAEIEKLQGELMSKRESLSQAEAVRDIKIRLIKSVNRRVDFRRIMYDEGRKVIAIQALFQPLLKKYVNQFIDMEGAYIRDAYSRYKTDYAYRSRITALAQNFPGRGARNLKKVLELFDTKSFEKWTADEKLFVAEHLPKTDWVKELNLEAIEAARAGSLQLDLQSEETQELLREILPPELLAELSRKELRKWTLEQMEELTGIVDKLYSEGREKLRAKREADRARADKLRKQIEKALKSSGIVIHDDDTPEEKERKQKLIDDFKEKKLPKILATEGVKGTLSEAKRGLVATANRVLHGYDALNIRRIARMLDNGKEGVNTSLLYYREDECFNKKRRAIEAQQKAFDTLIKEQGIELSDLYKTVDIEFSNTVTGVDDNGKAYETVLEEKPKKIKLTVDELLYAYAAKDNERSYAAVAGGNLFDEIIRARFREAGQEDRFEKLAKMRMDKVLDAAKEILHNPETGEKYQALLSFIQNAYDEQGKRLNQTAIDVYNAPMWIEEHYVPLQRLEANGDVNEATLKNELLASVAGTGSAGSWIARGNMKSRVDISYVNQKPVRMGLVSTWTESVESTEHIIAYGELNRDLNRIYRGRDAGSMKQYMENRYGKDMVHYIDQYLKEVANPNMYNNPRTALDRVVRVMRGKTAPAYLAWKMSGIIKQACTSPWPYLQYMSPMRYAKACMECMHKDTQDAIKAKSVFMNSRVYDPLIDLINEQKSRSENKVTHALNSFEKLGMQGLEWVDWACVAPGWLAVYQDEYARLKSDEEQNKLVEKRRKELESYKDANGADWVEAEAQKARLSENKIERLAVRKADDIVRMTQPSSRNTDIAPLFKGTNEVAKALLQFTTSLNVIWQNLRADLPVAIREREMKQVVGCIAGYMLAGAMVGMVSAGFDDDDDDAEKKAMRILYWNMTQFTDSVPVLGSMATSTAEGLITGKWQYGSSRLFPVPEKAMNTVRSLSKGDFEKALINFGQVVGLTTGLPVSGVKEALYVAGIGDGKDGLDFHPTAVLGRRPKE